VVQTFRVAAQDGPVLRAGIGKTVPKPSIGDFRRSVVDSFAKPSLFTFRSHFAAIHRN
jgi:hypothetical protein